MNGMAEEKKQDDATGAEEVQADEKAKAGADKGTESGTESNFSPEQKTEIDRLIESESDRKVTKALQTAQQRWEAEKEAALEAEREKAEQQRLQEEGKWKELAEKRQKELDEYKSAKQRAEFLESSRSVLKEHELSEFEDVLLGDLRTVEGVKEAAEKLRELKAAAVETEVNKRLGTGARPGGGSKAPSNGRPSAPVGEWTTGQKLAFIKNHGREEYEALVMDALPAKT